MANASIGYRVQYGSCYGNTGEAPNLNTKVKKKADSRFALSNQNIVEQLKENAKSKNTLKATQTWLNVWQTWATERKLNQKLEEYEHEKSSAFEQFCGEYNK